MVVISDHVKWEDVSVKYVIVILFLGTTVIIMLYGVVWVPAQDICDAVELCDSKPSINSSGGGGNCSVLLGRQWAPAVSGSSIMKGTVADDGGRMITCDPEIVLGMSLLS